MRTVFHAAFLGVALACVCSTSVSANVIWNWSYGESPGIVGPSETVYIPAVISNDIRSTEDLVGATFAGAGASFNLRGNDPSLPPPDQYYFNFGRDLTFPWDPFAQELRSINLAPGQSYEFTWATLTPVGEARPGAYGGDGLFGNPSGILAFHGVEQTPSNSFTFEVATETPEPAPPGNASLLLFSSENTSAPLTVNNFNSSLPTILVTHGWQRGEDQYFGDGNLPRQDTINAILTRLKEESIDANVILYNWEGAYTTVAKESYQATYNAGVNLGTQLSNILGSDYGQSLHMIGHSHGTGVNGFAVDILKKQGLSVDLFTILDSPMDVTSSTFSDADFPTDFFAVTLAEDAVGYVENYPGDGPGAFGAFIQGAGNYRLPGDHSAVPIIYGSEIVALDKIKRLLKDTEWPWLTPSRENIEASTLPEWQGAEPRVTTANFKDWLTLKGVSYDVTCEELGAARGCSPSDVYRTLIESSPSAVSTELVIPYDAIALMFDYVFGNTGDGDWISLYFKEELLWELSGLSMAAGLVGTAFVDVRGFGGTTGTLKFLLNSVGESNLEFAFANLRYLNHSGSVPLPSTVSLFMLGVAILVRHRRTYRHGRY